MIEKHLIHELLFCEKEGISSHTDQMQNILATMELSEEVEGITMLVQRDGVGRDGEMKALLKEKEDKSKCGPLYKSNIVFCVDIGRQEEVIEEYEEPTLNAKNVSIYSKRRIRVHVFLWRGRKYKKEAKLHHFLMEKKVKMKLHLQMNKYGL